MNDEQQTTHRYGTTMLILMWIAILILATVLLQRYLDDRNNPNQQLRIEIGIDGQEQLVLQRNPYGHYVASGLINNQPAVFLLDTGATNISIPASLAERFGLEYGYPVEVNTANGRATVYLTHLDQVKLGPIVMTKLRANINPNMDGEEILLGMSFLKHLHLTQVGNELILSKPK